MSLGYIYKINSSVLYINKNTSKVLKGSWSYNFAIKITFCTLICTLFMKTNYRPRSPKQSDPCQIDGKINVTDLNY